MNLYIVKISWHASGDYLHSTMLYEAQDLVDLIHQLDNTFIDIISLSVTCIGCVDDGLEISENAAEELEKYLRI